MAISLSKLDMPWLDPNRKCQPGRYLLPEEIERQAERARQAEANRSEFASPYFMPDVDQAYGGAWKSIIDGSVISSRANWKEHNKRNDVVSVGNDFWCQGMEGGDTAANLIKKTKQKMGYDPSLVGNSETFAWKKPENVK